MILLGAVVQRIGTTVRRLDAERVGRVVAGYEIVEPTRRTTIVHAAGYSTVASAIDADLASRFEQSRLGLHVDDAGGAQAVFGWQGAGDQLHRIGKSGIERLSKHRDAFWNDDAVQAVLQAVVLAAHMQLPEGVLRHARRLEHDLVEQRVLAARLVVDVLR